jgi:uncharacterized protein (DUF302 family)
MTLPLSFQVRIDGAFEDVVERVEAALREEGFGVLTRIDVQATLKEKLDVDFRPYLILGACNPPLAHRALISDPQIGVMLPCNVTLEQDEEGVLISIANPEAMLTTGSLGENAAVCEVAAQARVRLLRVQEALS